MLQTHPCITRLDLMHYHQLILKLIYHGSLLFKEYGRISYRAIKVPVTCIYIYFLYQRNIGLIVVFALAFVFRKINVNFIGLTYFHSSLLFFSLVSTLSKFSVVVPLIKCLKITFVFVIHTRNCEFI